MGERDGRFTLPHAELTFGSRHGVMNASETTRTMTTRVRARGRVRHTIFNGETVVVDGKAEQ